MATWEEQGASKGVPEASPAEWTAPGEGQRPRAGLIALPRGAGPRARGGLEQHRPISWAAAEVSALSSPGRGADAQRGQGFTPSPGNAGAKSSSRSPHPMQRSRPRIWKLRVHPAPPQGLSSFQDPLQRAGCRGPSGHLK